MRNFLPWAGVAMGAMAISSCGFHHAKYENPITKDTQQPDKLLYDKAIKDIEKGRYEIARLTLNTLINTYDTSEYLAKAKLAIADSWYREGGMQGLVQSEAEYKDFELFYPTMPEAAESQEKICMIHYRQMDKPDRDPNQALRAEQECKQLLTQYPNSKFAPQAEQLLRNIQEVLGEAEMRTGDFYHHKGSWAAAANRLGGLVDQYPLYSRADEALWKQADAYGRMGPRFRQRAGEAYAKIIHDYPLSEYSDDAKKKLKEMELPIPDADPAAAARMRYEAENRKKPGLLHRSTGFARSNPETGTAAKAGSPTMANPRQNIPANVPSPADVAAAQAGFNGDVTVAPVTNSTALDNNPDARSQPPADSKASADSASVQTPATDTTNSNSSSKGKNNNKKKK
jgi:outer membrane protein assembly factor BamD